MPARVPSTLPTAPGPSAAPALSFPSLGTVFLVPDGGSVSHVSWITWTAAEQVPSGMSFLLPLPMLSLSVCLPEAGTWPQASEASPPMSTKAPRRAPRVLSKQKWLPGGVGSAAALGEADRALADSGANGLEMFAGRIALD